MELQIIAEEIIEHFWVEYAHQEQLKEQKIFFTYHFSSLLSPDDRQTIVIEILNTLASDLKHFSIFTEDNTVVIRSDV